MDDASGPVKVPSAEVVLGIALRHLIPDQGFLAAHHWRSTLRARAWRSPESAEMPGRLRTADRYFRVRSLRDRVLAHDHVEQLLASFAENRGRGGSHAAVSAARHLCLIAAGLAPELIQLPHLNLPVLLSQKHRIAQGRFKERSNQETSLKVENVRGRYGKHNRPQHDEHHNSRRAPSAKR